MKPGERSVRTSGELAEEDTSILKQLHEALENQMSAISSALVPRISTRDFDIDLAVTRPLAEAPIRAIRVSVTVGTQAVVPDDHSLPPGAEAEFCQTIVEICGEDLDGYIYCSHEVCVDAITHAS
jgi:hypothetical protein